MRTALAVTLCFVLGACATFGGGGPDIYGINDLQTSADATVWIGLEKEGAFEMSVVGPTMPEERYNAETAQWVTNPLVAFTERLPPQSGG